MRSGAARVAGIAAIAATVYVIAVHKAFELGLNNGISYYDSGLFASIGQGILHGQLPYASFWSDKPPGIFLVDAGIFAVLPANPWSVHVAELVFALATSAAFYWAARQVAARGLCLLTSGVFAYVSTLPALNQGGNLAETYWQLPILVATGAAASLLVPRRDVAGSARPNRLWVGPKAALMDAWSMLQGHGRLLRLVVAGCACGAAILLKPQAVLNLFVIAGFVAFADQRLDSARRSTVTGTEARAVNPYAFKFNGWGGVAIVVGSATAVAAPVCAFFWISAGTTIMGQWISYDLVYANAVSISQWWHFVWTNPEYLRAIEICALLWASAAAAAWAARHRVEPRIFLFSIAGFLAGLAAALGDRHPFPHDLLLSVPGTLFLATTALGALRPSMATVARYALPAIAAGTALVYLSATDSSLAPSIFDRFSLNVPASTVDPPPAVTALGKYPVVTVGGLDLMMRPTRPSLDQDLAYAIDRLSAPGSRLYVFGSMHGMYFATSRRPESRFLSNGPLVDTFGGVFAKGYNWHVDRVELMERLQAEPPAIILAGGPSGDLELFPGLAKFVTAHYRPTFRLEGYVLYTPRGKDR